MEKKYTSENNIDMYYYPNHHTHSFCLSLYIKAGVMYEEEKDNGITHFLEHMLFRNINHIMNGEMYRELDKRGLYFNGATYKEFMQLYIIGAPKHFHAAFDILSKAFSEINIPVEVLETEAMRVKAEIREADEYKTLDYFAGTHCWDGTSLSRTITGRKGNISRFSKNKMEAYRKSLFTNDNIFFYVTGNVSEEDMKTAVKKTGNLPVGNIPLKRFNMAPVPADFGKRKDQIHIKSSKNTIVQFSFDFVREKYTYAELSVLYDILFSGENSIVHQELSEKRGMIYSYTSVMEKYSNIGRLFFTYEVKADDLYSSISIVKDAIENISDNLEDRLSMVLPEYTDNALMIYDDNEDFNWNRAYENHIMGEKMLSIEDTTAEFSKIKPEKIRVMAHDIFRKDNLVLCIKGNKKKIDIERISEIL